MLLERRLREAIEAELDRRHDELAALDAVAVREQISSSWPQTRPCARRCEPAAPPELGFRFREAMHAVLVPLVLILLLPLVLVLLVIGAVLLRFHEARDVPGDQAADPAHAERLAELEDHSIQNPLHRRRAAQAGAVPAHPDHRRAVLRQLRHPPRLQTTPTWPA